MTPDPTPAASEAVLLPCPKCDIEPIPEFSQGYFSVGCGKCGCMVTHAFGTEAEAIAAWNTRPPAAPADLAALKNRVDTRLNNHLCDMKEGWDDSVSGFNDAWDIVRAVFAEAALAASAAGADGGAT